MNVRNEGDRGSGRRRTPDDTRAEILDAARAFLSEHPFRDLTVARLMDGTSVGRSSFYIHFSDLYALAAALLEQLDDELERATREARQSPDFPKNLDRSLAGVVELWARNGLLLRAIAEASTQDGQLDDLYRRGFTQRSIDRVRSALESATSRGSVDPNLDTEEVSTLLILMVDRYLADRLGRQPQREPAEVRSALVMAWRRILGADLGVG